MGGRRRTINFVEANGNLDWDVISRHTREFNQVMDSPTLGFLDNWNDGNHGYESGLNDTNIDPTALSDPGNPSGDCTALVTPLALVAAR